MTPEQFIAIWQHNTSNEKSGAQSHFNDLCELLGVDKPRDPDNYCFERGAQKSGGGDGWADVWKRNHFGWENKKPGADLDKALKQLTDYALKLDSPPLLVVCDRIRIIIHTAFTGYPDEPREIKIHELTDPAKRQTLTWVFTDPEKLRPLKSTKAITELAAGKFASIANAIRARGADGQEVAHFLVQCLFCMFAEDQGLLPNKSFTNLLDKAALDPSRASSRLKALFETMRQGGDYGDLMIDFFNGGLFKIVNVPSLEKIDLKALHQAASEMDWRSIDPTIFGTLFEYGLDPAERSQLGANYTDTTTIAKIITPLITEPLLAEWDVVKAALLAGKDKGKTTAAFKNAKTAYQGFMLRLNTFLVLDPACGSGNFLYLSLKALRDIEKLATVEARELGIDAELSMQTGPHNILGIEINEFAAELARVTVWIGDIQWCLSNGYPFATNPILKPLESIQHRDALMTTKGLEAKWPQSTVILGNPPFLGQRFILKELGEAYTKLLRSCYKDRVPGDADLVTYWFEKARAQIEAGKCQRAGLVATNSIRGGANQKVLARICEKLHVFNAWSDQPWFNDGVAVRVSLVCFEDLKKSTRSNTTRKLDGQVAGLIHADLTTGAGLDLTRAKPLHTNAEAAFSGFQMNGSFDIPIETALNWLKLPNPNGLSNANVLHPYTNAKDMTSRSRHQWVIDFMGLTQNEAALFEKPFEWVLKYVKPERDQKREVYLQKTWWLHKRSSPDLRKAIAPIPRFIATPMVSKHRLFVWLPRVQIPENAAIVIARADDTTFGILHSRFHELWSLKMCTWMGKGNDPRYTPTTCFETFPFPPGLSPADTASQATQALASGELIPAKLCVTTPAKKKDGAASVDKKATAALIAHASAIATAAHSLTTQRDQYLNPKEWIKWEQTSEEKMAGYPKRPVAMSAYADVIKKRTLTNLYNDAPEWLKLAHQALDKAVANAYNWADYTPETSDDEILRRLLALNLAAIQTKEASEVKPKNAAK